MEETQFQIRRRDFRMKDYPISLDQELAQGDAYRKARNDLERHLQSIEQFYSKAAAGTHTGQPDCNRCLSKKKQINQAYREYYLYSDPAAWDSGLLEYREEMARMLEEPNRYPLEEIHRFSQMTLREHLKNNLSTTTSADDPETHVFKNMVSEMFAHNQSLPNILSLCLDTQINNNISQDAGDFISKLQRTTEPKERAQIYIDYYCANNWSDDSILKNFKAKYARMFSESASHDYVLSCMQKEAKDTQTEKLRELKDKLTELQMAKSAHLKGKKRKAEKADQKKMVNHEFEGRNKVVGCGLPRCRLEVDLKGEIIECMVCDWLVMKGLEKPRVYYCSVEHAEEDFDEHDRNDHQCCMGNRCFYNPEPGPPNDTGSGGICRDCHSHKVTSYFCSEECYTYNLEYHRQDLHADRGVVSDANSLEIFRPSTDLELL